MKKVCDAYAVTGFRRDRLSDPERAGTAVCHFALRRTRSRLVVRTLLTSGCLTGAGHALVAGSRPEPGRLAARARAPSHPDPHLLAGRIVARPESITRGQG
ncbi:hypothetical protein [Streptomyces atrovirens]|uniref:hypothetical protein n=1 Tax=Streptomyces atrovirens TaxID=285556 RepID=UPI0031DB19B1